MKNISIYLQTRINTSTQTIKDLNKPIPHWKMIYVIGVKNKGKKVHKSIHGFFNPLIKEAMEHLC